MAKIVRKFENMEKGGGGVGDDCFSKDDIQKRICIKQDFVLPLPKK